MWDSAELGGALLTVVERAWNSKVGQCCHDNDTINRRNNTKETAESPSCHDIAQVSKRGKSGTGMASISPNISDLEVLLGF
jgi:hypothetical protein